MSTPTPFVDGYRLIDGNELNGQIANPTWSISEGFTATPGGTAANSSLITDTITQVTTATVPNAGVVLPQAISPGRIYMIINVSGNAITVYADGGSTINGIPGNIGYTQETGDSSYYIAVAVNDWYKLDFLPVGFPKSFIEILTDINALRAWSNTSASSPAIIALVQNYVPNDGGGLFWIDITDNTSPDNGTTIIVDAVGNRWKRELVQAQYIQNTATPPFTATTVQSTINQIASMYVSDVDVALKNTPVLDGFSVLVAGYYAPADSGGGVFTGATGQPAGYYVDNGGTIIVPTGGDGSSAWLRVYEGPINVKYFGAKGDNVADDTVAIQTAISENPGGTVYFPSGIYLISDTIQNDPAVSMIGDGSATIKLKSNTTLSASPQYNARMFWIKNGSDITVYGLIFDENKRGNTICTGSQLYSNITRLRVENVTVYDNNNVGITVAGSGGSPGNCESVIITNNIIWPLQAYVPVPGENGQEGIKTSGNRRVVISNNYMRTFFDDGISLNGLYTSVPSGYNDGDRDIVISGNVIEAWSRPIVIDGWCENLTITNNTCRKMNGAPPTYGQPLILITNVISFSISASYARNVTIADNACIVDTDFANEVTAIGIACGVNINVSNNTLLRQGSGTPTKPAIDVSPVAAPAVKTLIGVKIADNTIDGFERGVYVAASGSDWPINVTIDGNLIQNVTDPIYFVGAASAARNWSVSNNKTNSSNNIVWDGGIAGVVQDDGNNSWNYSFGMPVTGIYTQGQKIWNTDIANGRPIGWCASDSGTQITTGQNLLSPFGHYKRFQSKTADYTIQVEENGTRFNTFGSTTTVVFTLPNGYEGMAFEFSAFQGQDIEVDVASGDQFLGTIAYTKMTILADGYATITCDGNVWLLQSFYGTVTLS